MENYCLPAVTTAAIFTSIFLLDLSRRNWKGLPIRAAMGVLAVLLMIYICQSVSESLGWILLTIPFAFLLISSLLRIEVTPAASDAAQDEDNCSCPCCHVTPCQCSKPCWMPKSPASKCS